MHVQSLRLICYRCQHTAHVHLRTQQHSALNMHASMRAALLLATAAADFQLLPIAPPLTTLTNLQTDPTDVFVCSWPKSGTTWMQAIVAHLVAPDRSSWKHVSEVTPFYDVAASWDGSEPSQALTQHFERRGRRCWNTHLLWSLIPKGGRYIYVVRDPADAVGGFMPEQTSEPS